MHPSPQKNRWRGDDAGVELGLGLVSAVMISKDSCPMASCCSFPFMIMASWAGRAVEPRFEVG